MTEKSNDLPAGDETSSGHETWLARSFGSSMSWNVLSSLATNGVTMVVFIFLTYKLDPAVFGIFALGVIIVDYFYFQAQSACLDAAVQRRAFTPRDMDTIYWAMTGVTFCVVAVCAFAGSWLASANNEPSLTYIMPVLALTLLPVPFSVPPNALMLRDHDFKGGAIRNIFSAGTGGAAALLVVFSPFPEWALIAQRGTQATVSAIVMTLRVRWWPGLRFSPKLAAAFLGDAGRIFAGQAVGSSYMRVLDLIVAFNFGAAAVGYMRIASRFMDVLNGTFISPISSLWVVLLATGTQTKGDRNMLYRRLSQMSALIALPIFGGLAAVSKDLVAVVLSEDYAQSGTILAILCMIGLFAPLTYFRNAAFIALHRLNLLIAFSVLDLVFLIGAALALSNISVLAVVGALVIVEPLRLMLILPILLKDMHTKAVELLTAVLPAYIGCALMIAAVSLVNLAAADLVALARLPLAIATGAVTYLGYLLLFHRNWSMIAIKMLRPSRTPDEEGQAGPAPVAAGSR